MDFSKINFIAVFVAALSTFILGGLWFLQQLFSKARMFGWSFIFALVMSLNLAMFLANPGTNVVWGIAAGALAGVGWVAMAVAIIGVFENKSWAYIAINGGYMILAFCGMGAILGAWR